MRASFLIVAVLCAAASFASGQPEPGFDPQAVVQRSAIRISSFISMPRDTVDTLATWQPVVVLSNFGFTPESADVVLTFSDTLQDGIVYADSHRVTVYPGGSANVQFRPFRFTVPGPYAGFVAVLPDYDSAAWDFWVSGGLAIQEQPAGIAVRPVATIIRNVLSLPGSTLDIGHSSLLDALGRKVLDLAPGENDVSRLAPGVYFVRLAIATRHSTITKVVITR